ncbi:TPA: hypothetical protein HA361_00005, partial [Candidatus Woesearchaeota archaeon]|nr:hypothetical protein [Candidatus Woesearchaeota archaeon]
MSDGTVHDGIMVINFTAGKRRESSSVAFGKVAVGNEFLGNAFLGGLMPILRCNRGRQARGKGA